MPIVIEDDEKGKHQSWSAKLEIFRNTDINAIGDVALTGWGETKEEALANLCSVSVSAIQNVKDELHKVGIKC